jgi:hypothetical protein
MNDIKVHKVVSYCQGDGCWEVELVYEDKEQNFLMAHWKGQRLKELSTANPHTHNTGASDNYELIRPQV